MKVADYFKGLNTDQTVLGAGFKRIQGDYQSGISESHIPNEGRSQHLLIKAIDGKRYMATLNRNLESWACPLEIKYLLPQPDGSITQEFLFAADWSKRVE